MNNKNIYGIILLGTCLTNDEEGGFSVNAAFLIYSVIFMAILYLTCSKYEYFLNVIIYTIGMGLLPTLFSFNGFGNLIIVLLFRFVIGLILIKLLTMINDYFQDGVYFFIAGIILEGFVSRFVLAFVIAFISAI